MKYACNITFVLAHDKKSVFLNWMRSKAIPNLCGAGSPAHDPRMEEVIEAGGEKPGPDHGLSISLHCTFDSLQEARAWHDSRLPSQLEAFRTLCGQHSLFFITMLEVIEP